MTYNVYWLYDIYDGENAFIHRAGMLLEKIREEKPHVICSQEVSNVIRDFLQNYLVDYHVVGHGRLGNYDCEGLSIVYCKDPMELFGLEHLKHVSAICKKYDFAPMMWSNIFSDWERPAAIIMK